VIAATRLRGGGASSARGAARFAAESVAAARAAGCTGTLVARADSALYPGAFAGAVRRAGAFFSVTVRMDPKVSLDSRHQRRHRTADHHPSSPNSSLRAGRAGDLVMNARNNQVTSLGDDGKLPCDARPDKVTCWGVPIIAPSARSHGLDDEDILHAFRNPVRAWPVDDEGMTMLVGPARNADLLEVGVIDGQDGPVIVHAMKARLKYLRWKKGGR
jgi:hypothetical protein